MSDTTLQITEPPPVQANSAEALLAQAVAGGADISTLERLIALREKVMAEKAKEAFNIAMALFQSECPVIKKTKNVDNKYKYAPIESIVEQVKDLIKKHGFRYSTTMELNEARDLVKVFCRVVHTLGHEEISAMEVPLGSKTAIMSQSQQVAAASTFAKRYAFLNAFGIMTGDEDNDAAKQEEPNAPAPTPPAPAKPNLSTDRHVAASPSLSPWATPAQLREIATITKQLGGTVEAVYATFGIKGNPTKEQAVKILDILRQKLSKLDAAMKKEEEEKAMAEMASEVMQPAPEQVNAEGTTSKPATIPAKA